MGKNGTAVLVAIAVLIGTLGCTSIPSNQTGCSVAFQSLPDLEPVEGMYVVVSEQLAGTLSRCSDVAEWKDELRRNPAVVGVQEIDESVIHAYLAGACGLLPEKGEGNKLCEEARALGYFL